MTADLFPETLLVSCEHDRVFTTSLKIAEHFRKRHQHVLRDHPRHHATPLLRTFGGPILGREITSTSAARPSRSTS